jgi:hypothetical protein
MICNTFCGTTLDRVVPPRTLSCTPSSSKGVPNIEGGVKALFKYFNQKLPVVQEEDINRMDRAESSRCPDAAKKMHTSTVTFLGYLLERAGSFLKR